MTTRVISFNANEKIETSFFTYLCCPRAAPIRLLNDLIDATSAELPPTSPVGGEREGTRSQVSWIFEANKKSHPSHLLSPRENRRFGAAVGAAERSEAEDVPRHATAAEWAGGAGRPREDPEAEKRKRKEICGFFYFCSFVVVGLGLCDLTV